MDDYIYDCLNAGFSKDGGIFINKGYSITITNSCGKIVYSYYNIPPYKNPNNYLISYYYDSIGKKGYFLKNYNDSIYITDLKKTLRNKLNLDVIKIVYIDKSNNFYLHDNYFNSEGDARYSKLYVLNKNLEIINEFTFSRLWSDGGKNIFREDPIGITKNGEIYYSHYRVGEFIRIYKLIPENLE